jgi:hypothetical protein
MVGDKIFNAYWPDRSTTTTPKTPRGMVELGDDRARRGGRAQPPRGRERPVIYVNLNLVPMDGGHKSVAVGLCGYAACARTTTPRDARLPLVHGPVEARSSTHERRADGAVANKKLNVFTIETTINNRMFDRPLEFLREERGRPHDREREKALKGAGGHAVEAAAGRAAGDLRACPAPYERDGRVRRRDRGRAREDPRALLRAVPGAGRGPGRHPGHRHSVHQPVQRQRVPEPAARAGAWRRGTCSTSTRGRRW